MTVDQLVLLKVLTSFLLDQAAGDKVPLRGEFRKKWWPPCSRVNSTSSLLSCRHVLQSEAVQEAMDRHGVQRFMNECVAHGYSSLQDYEFFLNGLDIDEVPVGKEEYMKRGAAIMDIYSEWKKKW